MFSRQALYAFNGARYGLECGIAPFGSDARCVCVCVCVYIGASRQPGMSLAHQKVLRPSVNVSTRARR
jgi:hypothetical protein